MQELLQFAVEYPNGVEGLTVAEPAWSLVVRCLPPLMDLFRTAAAGKLAARAANQSTKSKEEDAFAFVARVSGLLGKLKRLRLPQPAALGLDEVLATRLKRIEEREAERAEQDAAMEGEERKGKEGEGEEEEEEVVAVGVAEGSGADHLLLLANQLLAFMSSQAPQEVVLSSSGFLAWELKELLPLAADHEQLQAWLQAFLVSLCDLLSQKKATKGVREVSRRTCGLDLLASD